MKLIPEEDCYHHSVISTYQVSIANTTYSTTVKWLKSRINNWLTISIQDSTTTPCDFKIETKPWSWPFGSNKGSKRLSIEGSKTQVDVYWDFKSLKLGYGPEPLGGYYVAMVCCDELVLLLGDCEKMAYKKTRARPPLVDDATMVSKTENVFGNKSFSARVRFDKNKREHDILVENTISESADSEMSINIDGVMVIHVSNLQWKFRGNETILVDNAPIQVCWDVYNWLEKAGTGHGTFLFKHGTLQEVELDGEGGQEMNQDPKKHLYSAKYYREKVQTTQNSAKKTHQPWAMVEGSKMGCLTE